MKSLWPHIGSNDDTELMMIAIANNRLDGVKAQLAKGVTGASRAHHPVFYPGEISMFDFACNVGNADAVRLLYEPGMDLDQCEGRFEMTPLMMACGLPWSPEFAKDEGSPQSPEVIAQAEDLIRWLVSNGANINAIRKSDRNTVLHFAVNGCSEALIDFLIVEGATVDMPGDDQPALVLAARANNVGAVRSLIRHGAELNRPCTLRWAEGRTALGVLLLERAQGYDKPESIEYLLSVGATEWP
jgi:ankyrin repeat protein